MKSKMTYHENLNELHVGTESEHSYFIPFGVSQDPFGYRESSERFELLNGEWYFKYYDSFADLEDFIPDLAIDGKQFRSLQIGSCTDMTSRSTRIFDIRYPTILLLYRMIIRSEYIKTIIIVRMMRTGYWYLKGGFRLYLLSTANSSDIHRFPIPPRSLILPRIYMRVIILLPVLS